ncbi:hypothetical protein ULMS_15860 [Patiriisocius marinistellae]|uniref:RNA-binding protein n=1 Tax=Patiriisocius marinistellae TaxID=2494560 RepID=A0A5J4FXM1_9FLAO|nr:DUF721 domain-containing protein [Patiriisocius marinistellae]GEQ86078.1 hypothetical protein ULMS_15860 [Patiriisocius marinistellae]
MSKKKRNTESQPVSDLLKDYIGSGKLAKGLDKVNASEAWHNVMGPGVVSYTTQVILERDVLYVQLTSSVLREELSYGKSKIIRLLNEELGKQMIDKLVLR